MLTINCHGRLLPLDRPRVMGILNTTPDSFYAGSRVQADALLLRAEAMIRDGADILDIGGQSTRPGSKAVPAEVEAERVVPAIEAVSRAFPHIPISVDTFYGSVVRAAVSAGAAIVNDVSAGSLDPDLLPTVATLQVPYVLMHMRGHPQTMQGQAVYEDVVLEVFDALNRKRAELLALGIRDLIIDPGFGFAKTIAHNFQLLRHLSYFHEMGCPLMVGLSRKATVYRTLNITPEEALNGTTVLHSLSLLQGAHLLRVHDVKEAVQAVRLLEEYGRSEL